MLGNMTMVYQVILECLAPYFKITFVVVSEIIVIIS